MRYARSIIFGILLTAPPIFYASAAVVINEVLFNPSAVNDTGLEKIELYNNAENPADLSGWDLYPDGIGYFTFPAGFSLAAKSFVAIHLRISGVADTANLYHSAASDNMSDTSGSAALFNATSHKKDTLVDFVEWSSKLASSTWESAAAESGLWIKGAPLNISSLEAGSSIGLANDGIRKDAASWKIYKLPTIGSGNSYNAEAATASSKTAVADGAGAQTGIGYAVSDTKSQVASGRTPPPSLHVYGGEDKSVFQGAVVEFRGTALGVNNESLAQSRFFWNLGDGTTAEGRLISHVYHFPGSYNISLNVSSGELTGADYLRVAVVRPELLISEAKSGAGGFIELYNNTLRKLDLGGFRLNDAGRTFAITGGTLIEPKTALPFANAVTGVLETPGVVFLRDALDAQLDGGDFSAPLGSRESFERASAGDQKFIKIAVANPGVYALKPADSQTPQNAIQDIASGVASSGASAAAGSSKGANTASVSFAAVRPENITGSRSSTSAASWPHKLGSVWFLTGSIVAGIFAAGAFLFAKSRF